MKCLLLMLACFLATTDAQYGYSTQSVVLADEKTGRIRGFNNIEESDFYLGGVMRVHSDINGVQCSEAFPTGGLEEVEAMLFAIDSINNDPDLLPNITLGYDIRDYCGADNIAIDEALEWTLTSSVTTSYQECDLCSDANSPNAVLAGVIGTIHSRVSAPLASFLRPFEIPQISYGSTTPALNNRFRYTYFLRTVPPDNVQAEAIVSIMLKNGWNVISAVHSNELYGESGIDEFRTLASDNSICLDMDEGISEDFTQGDYAALAQRIYNSSTRVVLAFSLQTYVRKLLMEYGKIQPPRPTVWIATDSWSQASSIREDFGDLILGMIGVAPFSPTPSEFTAEYYREVTPATNARDPYFADYCKSVLSSQGITCTNHTSIASVEGYAPGTFAPFVIPSVYSVAHGLNDFLNENCDRPIQWNRTTQTCKGQNATLNTSVLFDYISAVDFTVPSTNARVAFDSLGNPLVAEYRVVNLQRTPSGTNSLVQIGLWNSLDNLVLDAAQEVQFGLAQDDSVLLSFESRCQTCKSGEIQVSLQSSCCHLCVPCTEDTYASSISSTECLQCGTNMWGNNPVNGSDGCVELEEVYLSYDNAWGIIIIILAAIGLISVIVVSTAIGLFFWTNPVIKSFGREQLILILIGLALCFIFSLFYIFRPSLGLCLMQRVGFWFSVTLIFAALLVKLVRVMRIFLGGIKGRQQWCIKPWHQVIFTFAIVAGQMVLVVISVTVVPPLANVELNINADDLFPTLIVTCANPHVATLVLLILYNSVLVILINGFSIFTIQFPKNFKEARNIAFATFAIGVVWIGFIPVYFATSNEYQSGSIALAMMCMAFCILACLILPRLYTAFINRDNTLTSTHISSNLEKAMKRMSNDDGLKAQHSNINGSSNGLSH